MGAENIFLQAVTKLPNLGGASIYMVTVFAKVTKLVNGDISARPRRLLSIIMTAAVTG
jgi:hypothetical protein